MMMFNAFNRRTVNSSVITLRIFSSYTASSEVSSKKELLLGGVCTKNITANHCWVQKRNINSSRCLNLFATGHSLYNSVSSCSRCQKLARNYSSNNTNVGVCNSSSKNNFNNFRNFSSVSLSNSYRTCNRNQGLQHNSGTTFFAVAAKSSMANQNVDRDVSSFLFRQVSHKDIIIINI